MSNDASESERTMLVILADTHGTGTPELTETVESALAKADMVAHAGDFTDERVLNAFEQRAERLVAVVGNSDEKAVRDRLPEMQVFEYAGYRMLLVHGHTHTETSLTLLARQENADIVIVGHTHRPTIQEFGEQLLVNPGSHADPRGNRAAFGVIHSTGDGLAVELRTVDGQTFETRHDN